MKRSVALVALLVLLLPGAAWSQGLPTATPEEVGLSSPKLARVTEAVKAEIAKGRYPGAVALVARRGKVAYFEALGQRDPQSSAPMTKDAIFRLYSMTKPFTSVAIMMLVEDGRMHAVLFLKRLVPVPVAHALAHGIGAVEELHKAHSALDEAACEEAVPSKAGLELVAVVHAV